jgi:hypothetical protein
MKKNLKNFVEAGYKKKKDVKNVSGYTLDEDLSTKRNKVYYDPNTGKAVHTIAGTDSLKDWSNNALIPLGLHQYSNRHKNSEKIQKKANEKYGKENVDLVSHSQSGHIAENLANKNLVGGKNTTLNPAIIGSHNKNIKVVKSVLDPVSFLTKTTKNDVKIIPKTINPITEHSTNILDKAKKNIFGFGIKENSDNKIMKYIPGDESEASSSEEEEEHEMKGCALHEQDIIDRMAKLSHDIHVHHYKHGVKPSIVKGFKILGEGIIHSAVVKPKLTGKGICGGKINRSKKFNSWFKDIGNKFKPLNKNLSPIKHQMTQSAVDNIAYSTMTPEQQAQASVDMFSDVVGAVKGATKSENQPEENQPEENYNTMYKPIIAQPVTETAYHGYYNNKPSYDPYDFNQQPASYARSYRQPSQISGYGVTMFKHGGNDGMNKRETAQQKDNEKYTNAEATKSTNKAVDIYNKGGFKGIGFIQNEQNTTCKPLKGKGATGKMLKKAAANATVNLLNAGSSRAVNEMETRNTTGKGLKFKKGSQEAKDHMAKIRAMRKK